MSDKTIESPTVGQFREFLAAYDQDAPLRIIDPDTGWTFHIIHVITGQLPNRATVWLTGKYPEMGVEADGFGYVPTV